MAKNGYIESVKRNGEEMISSAIRPNFIRADIDNDALPQVPRIIANTIMGVGKFRRASKTLKAKRINVFENNGVVIAEIEWRMRYAKTLRTVYKFDGEGVADMSMTLAPKGRSFERYGFYLATYERSRRSGNVRERSS